MTALEALRAAQYVTGRTDDEVRALCVDRFGRATERGAETRWSDLNETQRWGLVCAVDPESTGPYGCSMAPFADRLPDGATAVTSGA